MSVPHIFDEQRRARRRDQPRASFADHDFLYAAMADEMLDRLGDVTRSFTRALIIGCPDHRLADALQARGIAVTCADPGAVWARQSKGDQVREDILSYDAGAFDLVLCCGTLDTVNDLPGALIAMNRVLEPDGLMLVKLYRRRLSARDCVTPCSPPTATGRRSDFIHRSMCARWAIC